VTNPAAERTKLGGASAIIGTAATTKAYAHMLSGHARFRVVLDTTR
jgi:hypothetical protein